MLEVGLAPLQVLLIIHAQRPLQERALLVESAALRLRGSQLGRLTKRLQDAIVLGQHACLRATRLPPLHGLRLRILIQIFFTDAGVNELRRMHVVLGRNNITSLTMIVVGRLGLWSLQLVIRAQLDVALLRLRESRILFSRRSPSCSLTRTIQLGSLCLHPSVPQITRMNALVVIVVCRRCHVKRLGVEDHIGRLLISLVRSQMLREAALQVSDVLSDDSSSLLQGGQRVNSAGTAGSIVVSL